MVCYDIVGKSNDKPLWRPLAHKFSTLVLRRRSSKRDRVDANEKAQETPANFKPLEVRSNVLEGLHVPNSWLVESPSANSHDKLTLPAINLSESQKSPRSRGFGLSKDSSRPFSIGDISGLLKTESDRASALASLTAADSVPKESSVLDRGRPVEARHLIHQPVRGTKTNRKSLPLELMFTAPVYNEGQTSTTPNDDSATKIDVASPSSFHESSPWAAEHRRRSTIRIVSRSPTRADEAKIDTTSTTTTDTTDELERRPSQSIPRKPVAPAPSPTASTTSTTSAPAPAPALEPTRTSSIRSNNTDVPSYSTSVTRLKAKQPSKLSDRLSWIKNLEEKNVDRPNKDLSQLPKRAGTVSDKLAMFEKKNMSGTANKQHLLAPTRTYSSSHSSTYSSSYNSARGRESIFSTDSNANVSSTRTSIDTTHRTSSVMSYYDDTFRQKLESLVGQEPAAAEEETEEAKTEEKK
ncbi:hypothetical protein FVEN_g2221 [Fusarium venenatum]|uniref:Uncharacterized protein n=1 Tax=Fusarium venenatum TaxID=56646 RepID=A0A2L2T7G1_9HYPO|nr:uncharacterized protein FVRRES_12649 [Fusarium venenatum]KAG8360209.1 hypothetical protein FVEN_g2221 [Fusarium venenatum]KAH6979243.1 hypothetical protein EDB82DRAFT_248432 [Fusarium venenatum]CEI39958.1 unnamed protein product [Fusarium venenatum]